MPGTALPWIWFSFWTCVFSAGVGGGLGYNYQQGVLSPPVTGASPYDADKRMVSPPGRSRLILILLTNSSCCDDVLSMLNTNAYIVSSHTVLEKNILTNHLS